jgi:hypothetical protein
MCLFSGSSITAACLPALARPVRSCIAAPPDDDALSY